MSRKRRKRSTVAIQRNPEATTAQDGYTNSLAYLGEASALSKANDYERHSISNEYELLTVLYRENWLAARIIDTPCEDMTRSWYSLASEIDQEKLDELAKLETKHSIKQEITNAIRWGRLYGGAAAVMVIKGQEDMLEEPLDYDMLQPGCFRGLIVLDKVRGIFPSIDLEEDMDDPEFGYPKYYEVVLDEETSQLIRIHHSRLLLFRGRQLPINEEINADYWGASEIEHVYEELQKRNASSANIAQLIFQANVAAMKISDYGEVLGMGTQAQRQQLYRTVEEMNRLRTSFGIALMGTEDSYEQHPYSFAGVAEVYETFMMDMAGAAEIPATKLFGRAPQGMNATGESDMKNYYEMISQLQERVLRPALEKLLPVMAMSLWGEIPEDLEIVFEPLGTTTPSERAEIMGQSANPIIQAFSAGIISQKTALLELRESGKPINAWTNITDEDIENAEEEVDTGEMDPMGGMGGMMPPEAQAGQEPMPEGAAEEEPVPGPEEEMVAPEAVPEGEQTENDSSDRIGAAIARLKSIRVQSDPERLQRVLEKMQRLQERLESSEDNQAEDGGPGSGPRPGYHKKGLFHRKEPDPMPQGNPGHAGRPGQVGGKQPVQGKQEPKAPAPVKAPKEKSKLEQRRATVAKKIKENPFRKNVDPRMLSTKQKIKASIGGLASGIAGAIGSFGKQGVHGKPAEAEGSGGGGEATKSATPESTAKSATQVEAGNISNEISKHTHSSEMPEFKSLYNGTSGKNTGMGNIDLNSRAVVKNPDGSISTEKSFSTNINGKEVLLPTIVNGKEVSEKEAINHYYKTGEHLGKFDTPEQADKYAQALHERQDWYYNEYLPSKKTHDGGPGSGPRPGYHKKNTKAPLMERVKFLTNPARHLEEEPSGGPRSNAEVHKQKKEAEEWANLTTHQRLAGTAKQNRHIRQVKKQVAKAAARGDLEEAKRIVNANKHYWKNDIPSAMKLQSETLKRQKAEKPGYMHDVIEEDGGPGSGNFGHAGRPGEKGGSAPKGGASGEVTSSSSGGKSGSNEEIGSNSLRTVKQESIRKELKSKGVIPLDNGSVAYLNPDAENDPEVEGMLKTYNQLGESKPVDNGTQESYNKSKIGWRQIKANVEVDGPKQSRDFIKDYLSKNPDVRAEIPKYMGVRERIANFGKDNPNMAPGTYDAITGEPKNVDTGFCVTFHQNNTATDNLGGYSDEEYAAMCAIAMKELGADGVNIGYFGNPEVSFTCNDEKTAKEFAIKHNQHSVYNAHTGRTLKNKKYNPKTNPINL